MAIYYLDVSIVSRGKGQSATAAAAYRAGQRIHDDRTGQTFDYTRRRSEIETDIHTPAGAPAWAHDREQLWNQVEKAERRCDAQLAREVKVAIPIELDRDQARQLVRDYVNEQFVARGMVADVAIHWEMANPHAHIMLTMREMGAEGLASKKSREWNTPETLETWREGWAVVSNRALERAGHQERIDHRSYAEQGLEKLPQVHLGPDAATLGRRGIPTEKGDHNRLVAEHNAVVVDLEKARMERRMLEAQRSEDSLTRRGWSKEQIAALAELQAEARRPLSQDDLHKQHTQLHQQLRGVQDEIRHIRDEENRLKQAASALKEYRAAQVDMQRLSSPLERVRRWFSEGAREQYRQAQSKLEWTERGVNIWGANSEPELQRQQVALAVEQTRLPNLQAKEEALHRSLKQVGKAMEGYGREAVQRYEVSRQVLERERLRDRDIDRGR